jgi:Flp pilus assembly protein TadD
MIFVLAAAATLAGQPAPAASLASQPVAAEPADPSILKDAEDAIAGGRLHEAKLIIARAAALGFRGDPIDRLTADLAFASGKYLQAMVAYQRLAGGGARQPGDCEKGAISALELGRLADARPLVECATAPADASWRAWNSRGVLADLEQDWKTADESYAHADKLAPENPRIINNQGWSMLIRGDWAAAIPYFEEAAALDGKSHRIANNLELAKAALAAELPNRRPGESDRDWAARLNDAGVAAEILGDKKRAVAAFTQALDASPVWYDRASNNLDSLGAN